MTLELRWAEYDERLLVTAHIYEVNSEAQLRELLTSIAGNPKAEEVFLEPRDQTLSGRDFRFRYSDDRTHAYATYGQEDLGYFESIGDPNSPEQFTSDGGSFSAGTAIPLAELENAVLEFFKTNEMPSTIEWADEIV